MLYTLFALSALLVASADYCSGGPTSEQDSNLGGVRLETINDSSDCPGQQGIQDKTSMIAGVSNTKGDTYSLEYDVTTCGQPYTRASAVWIDWNNNQEFEASEQLGSTHSTTASSPTETVTVSFTVPDNTPDMTTRMRVMVQESSSTNLDPCSVYAYGGAKDFTIEISASGAGGGTAGAGGFGGGAIFLVTLAVVVPLYCGIGFFLNHRKEVTGMERIPQYAFWKALPGYTITGCKVTFAGISGCIAKLRGQGEEDKTYEEI